MTAAFTHLEPGTPEAVWRDELSRRTLAPLHLVPETLVVVAAHPDDETLGAAGLMARAAEAGARVVVVVATDGEGSHPHSPTHTPDRLARLRRQETERAVVTVAPAAEIRFLGLPDGLLAEHRLALRERLGAILDAVRTSGPDRVAVASPWSGDKHRDHRIAAEVASEVATERGLAHVQYPVWAWHWGMPADLPWDRAVALQLTADEREAKSRAIACHVSQTEALSDEPGDEVMLHAAMVEHFQRDLEVFFVAAQQDHRQDESLDAAWFDDFYRRNGDDPWRFETRWYEERKRALTLAALPARELGTVLEVGCATGLLTVDLARRARRVIALDPAAAAVRQARSRADGEHHVSVVRGAVPGDWPAGRFDTIVVSEVGYYLSAADLRRTTALADGSLAADGCLLACHWRHPVPDYPQSGDDVHAALRKVDAWETLSLHEERDFLLEVFARRPARSVAQREGLS